ncbi:MAG: SurA N-terminal domain-containing protein [Pyrinomonadaceae bacterium]
MLKFFSRLERTRNVVLIIFAILMAVSLVFFYAPNRNAAVADPARNAEVVAEVGNEDITVSKLALLKENYRQMFGGQFSMAQFGGDRRLLDGLIRQQVISQEAARLGLAASDAEVADQIRKTFRDPTTGNFVGFDRYRESVASRYGNVEDYERQVRDQIAAQKLEAFVTAGARVSEDEVREDFRRRNTVFDLVYVPVTAEKLAPKIEPSEADLRAYYDSRATDFRILEEQKKIRYVYIDQTKLGEKIEISDADLQAEYDQLSPENKQAGVRVQQIVLRIARPDLDEAVRTKAEELVQKARGDDGNASAEEFAELARGNSEDPATATNGGTISGVVRKNANKPDDPLQTTLTMTEGAISEPIKYGNAYYILRRGESVPKTFADARTELLVSLRNRRSYAVAAQLAARVAERLKETKDVSQVAAEFAAEASMNQAEMVRETPYVKPGDTVPEIGSSPQFEEAIKPLANANDVGERVSIKGGFAVPLLVDKKIRAFSISRKSEIKRWSACARSRPAQNLSKRRATSSTARARPQD